ncbi:fructosamine-3-kinase-like [Schistocerca nitens]|uniref:fructosamine-3-kinase-like n=1 Tax=Schistocerca nitens TaxID=7011 RepID=UPI00211794A5|nr:fructosamine-3-kinase-like [Schistocerca nitens]
MPVLNDAAETAIKEALKTTTLEKTTKLSSDGVNKGKAYLTDKGVVYIKQNITPQAREIFDCEYESLEAIAGTNIIHVPKPLAIVDNPLGGALFVSEYIDMKTLNQFSQELGQQLARLHLHNAVLGKQKIKGFVGNEENVQFVKEFGFHVKTRFGNTLLENEWCSDWPTFFVRHRLSYQFRLLEENYADTEARELWSQLLGKLPQFFEGADIKPSLLHGNLQRDNIAETNSHPVTFHPASFFGHQDFDLVTSQMYGGLGQAFYNAYYDIIPRAPGSRKRNQIYKLFHLLNKWNQSGEEHKKKAISLMKFLLKGP